MKKLIYLFSMLLLFSSCTSMIERWLGWESYKDPNYPDHMPEKTKEGNNTFGCYIDGKLLAVQGTEGVEGSNFVKALRNEYVYDPSEGHLSAHHLEILIEFENKDLGYIFFSFDTTHLKEGINHCDVSFSNKYATNDSIDVDITFLDEEKHIVCGEFDKAILYDSDNIKDFTTLTKGQFDVKYELSEYNSKNR